MNATEVYADLTTFCTSSRKKGNQKTTKNLRRATSGGVGRVCV